MKKFLILLLLTITFCAAINAQQPVTLTVVKKNQTVIDSVDYKFNPAYIYYVKKATQPVIGYQDFSYPNKINEYTVIDHFDTVANRANKFSANLIKLGNVVPYLTRDTSYQWLFNIPGLSEIQSYSSTKFPTATSQVYAKWSNVLWKQLLIKENPARIYFMVDSTSKSAKGRKMDSVYYKYGSPDTIFKIISGYKTYDTIKRR